MNAPRQRKFKVFANGVALALAEVIFWAALFLGYYSIKRIAPNVQLENEAWWAILLVLPISLVIFLWGLRQQRWAKTLPTKTCGRNCCPTGVLNCTDGASSVRMALAAMLIGVLDLKVGHD